MSALRILARTAVCPHRIALKTNAARALATAAATKEAVPVPGASDPKITKLVEEISALNLLQVAELTNLLKVKLNIQDTPMMAMSAVAAAPGPAAAAAPAAAAEEKKPEKTEFTVKLVEYSKDLKHKSALIKLVKDLIQKNVVEAKKFVEESPKVIKEGVSKEEAEKIKADLEKIEGTKVALE
eukprot:Colp12_sorted_trinity150504_noHs@3037